MTRKLATIFAVVGLLLVVGFAAARELSRSGADYHGGTQVTLYAEGGGVIQEWDVPGEVTAEDGVYTFVVEGRLVRVSGTVVAVASP